VLPPVPNIIDSIIHGVTNYILSRNSLHHTRAQRICIRDADCVVGSVRVKHSQLIASLDPETNNTYNWEKFGDVHGIEEHVPASYYGVLFNFAGRDLIFIYK
jgi:hypothetical protein